jgi:hypothetical protein
MRGTDWCDQAPTDSFATPIYTSMLCGIVGTGLMIAPAYPFVPAMTVFLAGTEIRRRHRRQAARIAVRGAISELSARRASIDSVAEVDHHRVAFPYVRYNHWKENGFRVMC